MTSNENTTKIRKFSDPIKAARAWMHKTESLYKQAIKTGSGIAKAQSDYMQARYNYNLLKG